MTYHEALDRFDGGVRQVGGALGTAGILATYPQPFLSMFPAASSIRSSARRCSSASSSRCRDQRNFAPPARLAPVLVGLLVVAIGATFGFNAGYAINPARDLGSAPVHGGGGMGQRRVHRRRTAGGGCRSSAPCIGGVLGGFVYDLFITNHHPPEAPVTPPPGRTSAGADQQVALS